MLKLPANYVPVYVFLRLQVLPSYRAPNGLAGESGVRKTGAALRVTGPPAGGVLLVPAARESLVPNSGLALVLAPIGLSLVLRTRPCSTPCRATTEPLAVARLPPNSAARSCRGGGSAMPCCASRTAAGRSARFPP